MVKKFTPKTDPKWTKMNKIDYKKGKKKVTSKMDPKWIITNRMAKKGLKMGINGLQTDPQKNRN